MYRCDGCGERLDGSVVTDDWHVRVDHDPNCRAVTCPVQVQCGPVREACGAPQPGSWKSCERFDEHDEHRATLTPGRTYVYWTGYNFPVRSRGGTP